MTAFRSRLRAHRDGRPDSGVTLVELLVTMMLMSVVSILVLTAVRSTHLSFRHGDDEAQGLADVRKVVERLGRDVRDARSVAAGADANHLVLWIDANSDYKQQSSETIRWELRASSRPGQYDVIRQLASETTYVLEATSLVSNIAFSYDRAAPATRLVTTHVTYDAAVNRAATTRVLDFAARLRNVE